MISIQSVTAFFMMFGLVGLTLRKEANSGQALAILGALAAGVASFWFIAKLIELLRRLQSSGNVHLVNAIGQEGSIYLTIPAGGVGKVQAVVQQRLKHVDAVARDGEAIPTGERVTIVGIGPDSTLVVDRIRQ
jgi:membrane-bound ClpP family serine protease